MNKTRRQLWFIFMESDSHSNKWFSFRFILIEILDLLNKYFTSHNFSVIIYILNDCVEIFDLQEVKDL